MGKKITISSAGEINWPMCCAKCRSKNGLTRADATSGHITSVSPTITGGIAVKSNLLDLSYPVCEEHSKGLPAANFITRNTAGFKMLRGFIYVFGPMSLFTLVMMLVPLITKSSTMAPPGGMIAMFVFLALAFIWILSCFRKLPLRIAKQTDDEITIHFNDEIYAREFARINRQSVIGS